MHKTIRLTVVVLWYVYGFFLVYKLSDESSTTVRRIGSSITSTSSLHTQY